MNAIKHPKWKLVFWAPDTVEPSMLRVPVVLIIFLFLWAIGLYIMDKFRIQYGFVLVKSASASTLLLTALILLVLYSLIMTVCTHGGYPIALGVSVFYLMVGLMHCLPYGQEARSAFYRLLRGVLWPTTVSFPEVLLADALTSISKVLKDLGTYLVVLLAALQGRSIIDLHDRAMILVAILASLPYMIRVRQCSIQLSTASSSLPVYLNMIKYCTAFPPIWLTYAMSVGYAHPNMPQIIAVAAGVNSVVSFLWDISMDWGLITLTRQGLTIPSRSSSSCPVAIYLMMTVMNFLLRFSWTINRWPGMALLHSSVIVLWIELLEVFRRSVWNILRIEWEVIQQIDKEGPIDR